jgi:hypothetical protein
LRKIWTDGYKRGRRIAAPRQTNLTQPDKEPPMHGKNKPYVDSSVLASFALRRFGQRGTAGEKHRQCRQQ